MGIDSWRQAREQGFLSEAQRLGTSPEMIAYLWQLDAAQAREPLNPREIRIQESAWKLIRGRGWPTETIRLFFLSSEILAALALNPNSGHRPNPDSPWLPAMIAPTAVSIPRDFAVRFDQQDLTRIALHEMVHARSAALPQSAPDPDFEQHRGLYQLSEGITEMITEQIIAISPQMAEQVPLLVDFRERSAELCRQAGLDLPAVERLAVAEVFDIIAASREQSVEQLGADFQRRESL